MQFRGAPPPPSLLRAGVLRSIFIFRAPYERRTIALGWRRRIAERPVGVALFAEPGVKTARSVMGFNSRPIDGFNFTATTGSLSPKSCMKSYRCWAA